jgi:integrase/GNAT superfamily N-acetyltransferase
MKFIDSYIKNLKSASNWFEKTESTGLAVRVMPSGNKSWVYRFTINGKRHKMTLGKYPGISLKRARELHTQAMSMKEQGINPIEFEQQQELRKENTVEKLIFSWYENYALKARKKPEQIRQQIDADIIPLLGKMELENLQARDITKALDVIVNRGAPIHANRVLSTIKQALNYAVSRGTLQVNPAIAIRTRDIGGLEKPRERYLSLEEIKTLWLFLDSDECKMFLQTKSAIKMIILTGVRTAEIRLAKWNDIDFKNSLWTIPPENTKGAITVKIHLADLTKLVLTELKSISDTPFVLPSLVPNQPLDENALPRAIRRIQTRIGIPEWTAHDLRRTFATQLGETLNVDPVVIEKCLGHKMPRIMATYNKNEMLPQRKEALEKWAQCIQDLLSTQEPSFEIITPRPKLTEEICQLIICSIIEVCATDYDHDPQILSEWLANKTAENLTQWIKSTSNISFIARDRIHNKVVGFVLMNDTGEILLNYVLPCHLHRGIGTLLFNKLEKIAHKLGLNKISVTSTITAKTFYEKNGFLENGEPRLVGHILGDFPLIKYL